MTVKVGIQDWLKELQAEKEEIEGRIAQAELNLELSRIKFNIANTAQNNLSYGGGRNEFEKQYTKPLEKAYDDISANYEKIKQNNQFELKMISTLISQVEASINLLDD